MALSSETSAVQSAGTSSRTLVGRDVLSTLGPALDDLHAATDTPVTARRPWMQTWVDCYPGHEPWAIVVDGPHGSLAGAALLARRKSRWTEIVALGHGPSDQVRFPARDDEAARILAAAVTRELQGLHSAWRLRVEQLPAGDPVAAEIEARLRHAVRVPGDGSPAMPLDRGRELGAYVSKRSRGVAKTMTNRIKKAGHDMRIEYVRDAGTIAQLLPEVERIRRERDAALVRVSDLDDEHAGPFWRGVVFALAARGEVQLTTLWLDDELTAYEISLLDGDAYRMWDGHFSPKFGRFSPGRLIQQESIRSAVEDGGYAVYDWMRGVEEYKLRLATTVVPAEHLLAWSSGLVRAASETPRRAKDALRSLKDRSPRIERTWLALKSRTVMRS